MISIPAVKNRTTQVLVNGLVDVNTTMISKGTFVDLVETYKTLEIILTYY